MKEALAELRPWFAGDVGIRRKPQKGAFRARRFDAADPIERDLLPEGNMPKLRVDSVWRPERLFMRKPLAKTFEDVRRRSKGAIGNKGAFELVVWFD